MTDLRPGDLIKTNKVASLWSLDRLNGMWDFEGEVVPGELALVITIDVIEHRAFCVILERLLWLKIQELEVC